MKKRSRRSRSRTAVVALAARVRAVAEGAGVQAIICGTGSGRLIHALGSSDGDWRLIAATPDPITFDDLTQDAWQVVRLPVRITDPYRQARHMISSTLRASKVSVGERVLCVVCENLSLGNSELLVVTDVAPDSVEEAVADLVQRTGVRRRVLEAALELACAIGRVAGRGKRVGALIALGDSTRALEGSKQLIPNPLEGHADERRFLTDPGARDMLIELAKLDGAFVVRGDGYIRTAGAFLEVPRTDVEIPAGLGARHLAAAALTARTEATAIAVSSSDGLVRVFTDGALVLQLDPDAMSGPELHRS